MLRPDSYIDDYSFLSFDLDSVYTDEFELKNSFRGMNVHLSTAQSNYLDVTNLKYLQVSEIWEPSGEAYQKHYDSDEILTLLH